jgi:hypothetical protein
MDLRETVERCGLEASGSAYVPVAGSCEQGNEPSHFIKVCEFLNWLSICFSIRALLHGGRTISSYHLSVIIHVLCKCITSVTNLVQDY